MASVISSKVKRALRVLNYANLHRKGFSTVKVVRSMRRRPAGRDACTSTPSGTRGQGAIHALNDALSKSLDTLINNSEEELANIGIHTPKLT